MGEEKVCGFKQWTKVILNYIPYEVCIDVEITVGYMIAHPNDFSPWYLWTRNEQLLMGPFVDVPEPFSDGF